MLQVIMVSLWFYNQTIATGEKLAAIKSAAFSTQAACEQYRTAIKSAAENFYPATNTALCYAEQSTVIYVPTPAK